MDTIVICSATAIIILSSGVLESGMDNINGIELTQLALSSAVGSWGSTFIAIAIFFLHLHQSLLIMLMPKVI